jgi:tetracycline 7-halogenase / FADH2 O2-dependent halogenase
VTETFDVAVVGAGFAGSLTALVARRLGRSVVLIESGAHPRFAIGESSSPLANLLLETLSDRYGLPRLRPLAAWGTWRRTYPEIACGLKRGFTFYRHVAGEPFAADPARSDQLLVAASPRDDVSDTHWYRPDFDTFLVQEAAAAGVDYRDRTHARISSHDAGGFLLETEHGGGMSLVRAGLLLDATGPGGFLSRSLDLPASCFSDMPETQGLFTHFENVRRFDEMGVLAGGDEPPYPPDDAALHHVFDGGWIWVLRFVNGTVSAGVAATEAFARNLRLEDGAPAWNRLLGRFPTIRDQFEGARAVRPYMYRRRLAHRVGVAAGENWALLPSAAAFVDPLLSTGFPLTLLGILRLGEALETCWATPALGEALREHGRLTLFEADTAALLVAALYARFPDFEVFAALTKLYFAAASYAESAHRLGRARLAGSFLSGDHPVFGPSLVQCCRRALAADAGDRVGLLSFLRTAIEPLDVIGLSDPARQNWYPVRDEDLRASRHKLGASLEEIEAVLAAMAGPASMHRVPAHSPTEVERDAREHVEGNRIG